MCREQGLNDKFASPLNFSGNKTRLLPLIHDNLPDNFTTAIDLFGGSFVVGGSLCCDKIYYNEKDKYIYNIVKTLKDVPRRYITDEIDSIIKFWSLSKDNKETYLDFRSHFNEKVCKYLDDKESNCMKWSANIHLLVLCFYSFNHFITFNKNGKFTTPSGVHRSSFNNSTEKKLTNFCETIQNKNIELYNLDYRDFFQVYVNEHNNVLNDTLWFIDPPYIISDSQYVRTYGNSWTEKDENDLYILCDTIDKLGGKFMLTNQLRKGDIYNERLKSFSKKYNTINTSVDFHNSNYQRKNKGHDIEIIVKNY